MKRIYEKGALQVQVNGDLKTNKIPLNRAVRQGDPMSPKLFTLALEDVLKKLSWQDKGINNRRLFP